MDQPCNTLDAEACLRMKLFSVERLPRLEVELFPTVQRDGRKEAIRRQLMSDVARIKILGMSCVALAALIYLLTESVLAYTFSGLLGAAGLHVLAFVWARDYFAEARARREELKAARRRQRLLGRMAAQGATVASGAAPVPDAPAAEPAVAGMARRENLRRRPQIA